MQDTYSRRVVLGGIAGTTIGLAGCSGSTPPNEPTTTQTENNSQTTPTESRTLQHGVLLPLTGAASSLGGPMRDAALLPTTQLQNSTLSIEVDVQVEDTATDPQTGISAAQALVNEGYPTITGAAASSVNISVSTEVFVPNAVVGCSPGSTSPTVTELEDNGYIYRSVPSDAIQGKVMAQVAADRLEASTASILFINDSYGQLLSKEFATAFSNTGGTINKTVSFQGGQSSYSSQLQVALAKDPDLLMIVSFGDNAVQVFRDFYAMADTSTQILGPDGLRDETLPSRVGQPMTNVFGTAPLAAGPGQDHFSTLYEETYDTAPGAFTSHAYDATAILLLANAAAGTNDGQAIKDQMLNVANPNGNGTEITPETFVDGIEAAIRDEEITYTGASSALDFDDNGDITSTTYELYQFVDSDPPIETISELTYEA